MKLRSGKITKPYVKKPRVKKVVNKEIHKVLNKMNIHTPESKFLVTANTSAAPVAAGAFVSIAVVPQGLTSVTRVGNNIRISRIDLVYQITVTTVTFAETSCIVGLLVDKEPAGALPTALYNTGVSAGPANVFLSDGLSNYVPHPLSKQQFRYGPSQIHTINNVNGVNSYTKPKHLIWRFPKGLEVEYSSTAGVIAEAIKNWPLLYYSSALEDAVLNYRVLITYTDA